MRVIITLSDGRVLRTDWDPDAEGVMSSLAGSIGMAMRNGNLVRIRHEKDGESEVMYVNPYHIVSIRRGVR